MRKTALTVMATLALVLMLALSAGAAVAGWGWEDCPPVSGQGYQNATGSAHTQWSLHVSPTVNDNALPGTNPGNK